MYESPARVNHGKYIPSDTRTILVQKIDEDRCYHEVPDHDHRRAQRRQPLSSYQGQCPICGRIGVAFCGSHREFEELGDVGRVPSERGRMMSPSRRADTA